MASMNVSLPLSLKERAEKIAAMQRLLDQAEASGQSTLSLVDLLAAARRVAGVIFDL
ncbi:MAG: hypothetical protein RJA87_1806 [Pseudomonadota bacterium]|jgi:antitoxin ParD1/3/4